MSCLHTPKHSGTKTVAYSTARAALAERMGAGAVVEAAITVANFGMVDRIANSIGIPLDAMAVSATSDFRAVLGIDQFPSARNTLPA